MAVRADDDSRWRWACRGVVLASAVVALIGARPYAGGWNDGSRLAAAEALGGYGTLAIDESVFVLVPQVEHGHPSPYPADRPDLLTYGTLDKLQIDGRFYSDKSPVPNVLMAALYRVWLVFGGPTAAERPDLFCWFLTTTTSGLAYVVAVVCVWRTGAAVGLAGRVLFLLTAAFAFGTVAPAYTRHVNGHILFLGAAAVMCLGLARSSDQPRGWSLVVGSAAGFGYTCDLGIGPVLLVCLAVYCLWTYWRAGMLLLVVLGALPWLATHHTLNYAVGGTLLPANMVPEYLRWPGSPFTDAVMTGGLKHSPGWFLVYAAELVVGKKGFLLHNIPLWLTPGGAFLLWRFRRELRPAVAFAVGWAGLSLLVYAATSSNYAGQCCSVRWFVPLLAPGFWVAALALQEWPRYRPDFTWLTGCGVALGSLMWWDGPWAAKMVPGLWGWVGVAGVGWAVVRWSSRRGGGVGDGLPVAVDPGSTEVTTRWSSAA
jgi:hypothetical protein